MHTLSGIPASSGVVVGRVLVFDTGELRRVQKKNLDPADAPAELERFELARRAAIEQLNTLHREAADEMGDEAAKIFLFHIGALSDKAVLNPVKNMIEEEHLNAEYAASHALRMLSDRFAGHPDSTFRSKVSDLQDLEARLIRHLTGRGDRDPSRMLEHVEPGTVIVARDLTPSQTAGFDRTKIAGFATDLGGQTSHTAIVARALGLPAVVGIKEITRYARDGQEIIVDSERGHAILDPDEEAIARAMADSERAAQSRISLHEDASLPAVTLDGVEIELQGNIEFPGEIDAVVDEGGVGVGLYRTEFLYLASDHEPTEAQHDEAYTECVERLAGRPLTIRTVDLGADKYTQRQAEVPERNPFLGLRSIRYCLQNTDMFRRQLRSILRASAHGPVKIMFPLVTNIAEFRRAKYFVRDAMEDLDEQGITYDREIPIGMMVEVPAAALMASAFAREVDFFSIGTNDLVQYTLAVDRTNERVASMYTPIHPAVLKLIRDVSRVGNRARIPVSCCGESAADPEFAALLIGLGVRSLSVTASGIPRLKKAIRGLNAGRCERIAKKAMSFDSEAEAASYVRTRIRKLVPEVFDGRPVGP